MSGVLRYTLVVRHPETSAPVALLEGQPVPDWASDLVHADDLDGADPVAGGGQGAPIAPAGNASRDEWAAYAASEGAPEGETADGGLTRDDLRAKYGA